MILTIVSVLQKMKQSWIQTGSNPMRARYSLSIFPFHCVFPWWPLREQEVLSELFIQSASPGGLCRLLQALLSAQNLPRPRCACQEKLPCLGPLPWVLLQLHCCCLSQADAFDFKIFFIQSRFAFVIAALLFKMFHSQNLKGYFTQITQNVLLILVSSHWRRAVH